MASLELLSESGFDSTSRATFETSHLGVEAESLGVEVNRGI
jgi:hypothetical protein